MGVMVSSSHIVSAAPFSSEGGLLTLFPSVGSHPWETVLHELLHHGSFPWGAVLQEQTDPACVPRRVTIPASNPAPAWLHWAIRPARSLLQHGLPTGSQPPSGIPLLQLGVPPGLQVDICSTMDHLGLQGHSLPHHSLLHKLQGNLCSGALSTSSPPSSLAFVSAELFLSHVLTPLSRCSVSAFLTMLSQRCYHCR